MWSSLYLYGLYNWQWFWDESCHEPSIAFHAVFMFLLTIIGTCSILSAGLQATKWQRNTAYEQYIYIHIAWVLFLLFFLSLRGFCHWMIWRWLSWRVHGYRICCSSWNKHQESHPKGNRSGCAEEAGAGTYREFVIFDEECVYPEYILLYDREM